MQKINDIKCCYSLEIQVVNELAIDNCYFILQATRNHAKVSGAVISI